MKLSLIFILFFVIIVVAVGGVFLTDNTKVFAASTSKNLKDYDPLGVSTPSDLLDKASSFILGIAIPLTTLMSIWAAILLMTSVGNPEKIKKGSKTFFWAIMGLMVIIIFTPIMNIVDVAEEITGANTVKGLINKIIKYVRNIGGPLSIGMFIYAGILIMSGIPDKIKAAYKILIWTSIAVVIISISSGLDVFITKILK